MIHFNLLHINHNENAPKFTFNIMFQAFKSGGSDFVKSFYWQPKRIFFLTKTFHNKIIKFEGKPIIPKQRVTSYMNSQTCSLVPSDFSHEGKTNKKTKQNQKSTNNEMRHRNQERHWTIIKIKRNLILFPIICDQCGTDCVLHIALTYIDGSIVWVFLVLI